MEQIATSGLDLAKHIFMFMGRARREKYCCARGFAANTLKLIAIVDDPKCALPSDAIPTLQLLVTALAHLGVEIE